MAIIYFYNGILHVNFKYVLKLTCPTCKYTKTSFELFVNFNKNKEMYANPSRFVSRDRKEPLPDEGFL